MKFGFKLMGMLLAALLLLTGIRAEAASNQIDWNKNVITVIGSGIAPPGTRAAQARILARRAAIADAYRQMAEIVQGVNVDATTTVEQMMVESDTITLKVNAVIRGAQVIDKGITSDGAYEVVMHLPLFGAGGLSDAVFERPERIEPFPQPKPSPSVTVTIDVRGSYTGLVIDCRHLRKRINPVMSPVIKNADNDKIYGYKNIDPDFVNEYGMVSYARSMKETERAGSNPLVIKAIDLVDHNANPVVSVKDANLILSENQISQFLEDTAVVFLY